GMGLLNSVGMEKKNKAQTQTKTSPKTPINNKETHTHRKKKKQNRNSQVMRWNKEQMLQLDHIKYLHQTVVN
ncbi:hypothetical protein ACNIU4_26835, partial [Escherichia coli]